MSGSAHATGLFSMHEPILEALRRGDTAQALAAANAASAADPRDAEALELLAAAQQLSGDAGAALASIDRAIALQPDEAGLHFMRAGLLLGHRDVDAAQAALARSIGLDPNLFGAYVMQAQLALGRNDLDEAERLSRLAGRIAPGDPELAAIDGMVALRRGDAVRAQEILGRASQLAPDHPQVRYALGFAYMAQGHLAFAEQAFRGVLGRMGDQRALRGLIADLVHQQGRPGEAAEEIAPLLADPATATPGLRRVAGELELSAGRPERALPLLREALAAQPQDRRILQAIMETWRRLGDAEGARATLEAMLATHPAVDDLWLARLAFEPAGGEAANAIVARWLAALPASLPALEARMALQLMAGDPLAAEDTARRILEIEPGRSSAELRLIDGLLARDPAAAAAHIDEMLPKVPSADGQRVLRERLAIAQDRAGRPEAAVSTWIGLHAQAAPQRLPPPPTGAPRGEWPELAPRPEEARPAALLWGAPGSGVERLAGLLRLHLPAFRGDRFGPQPPRDPLQSFKTTPALQDGTLDPAHLVASWRQALPARGIDDGQLIDWLPWWDNSLLLALRPYLPEGQLLVALRDPRDMLLDWLAFGEQTPFAMPSPLAAAGWLAAMLHQVAALDEQSLYPHRLLRLDEAINDPQQLSDLLGAAINTALPPPPAVPPAPAFPAGHWRTYAQALAEPFALLAPVARRLGYAEA
jgi:tetratricopeptide (TPR) repeat protein